MKQRLDALFSGELGALMLLSHVVLGNNLVTDRFTRRYFGMPVQAWSALYAISLFPGIRAKEIGVLLPRPQNTISRALAMLERRGFLEQRPSPDDAREKLLFITPDGQAVLQRLVSASRARQEELFGVLSEEELRVVEELLGRIASNPRLLESEKFRHPPPRQRAAPRPADASASKHTA